MGWEISTVLDSKPRAEFYGGTFISGNYAIVGSERYGGPDGIDNIGAAYIYRGKIAENGLC